MNKYNDDDFNERLSKDLLSDDEIEWLYVESYNNDEYDEEGNPYPLDFDMEVGYDED